MVPLALGRYLRDFGVRQVVELDWWQAANVRGAVVRATPARHCSARRLRDRNRTLWSGFVLEVADRRYYFAGDTAHRPAFAAIGDWVALPAGNLGDTSAFGKALVEARRLGLIERIPRLLAVQAAGAAPFARAFAEHFVTRVRVQAETRATAIRIGDPASWDRGVAAIADTRGVVESVADDEIFAAKRAIDRSGGCEPASAASVAGVRALVARRDRAWRAGRRRAHRTPVERPILGAGNANRRERR